MRTAPFESPKPQVSGFRSQVSATASPPSLVIAHDRPADVVAFESAVVDFFVGTADMLGIPRSVAAIYGIVFASPTPLSFAEIAARLDFSKGSVSQGLRVLRDLGALKEVSKPSDRAELFEPDVEMRKFVGRYLETRLQTQLDLGRDRLAELQKRVPGRNGDGEVRRARLKQLQTWNAKARALLPVARAFLNITRR